MASKLLKIPPTREGFEYAYKWLMAYKKLVSYNAKNLLGVMLVEGEGFAINALGHLDTGETLSTIRIAYRNRNHGVILVGGNAIWIEFGTGVTKNRGAYPHPKAQELGMNAIGTYVWPDQRSDPPRPHGADPDGWYYIGDDGRVHHTKGITANMFFYNTAKMLRKEYVKMAKEIFK